MAKNKHIVLGAGGAVSVALAGELIRQGEPLRLVSRRGFSIDGAECVRADLLDAGSVLQAIDPGSNVYLLAGLPYNATIWREQWRGIMHNTIEACAARGARLICRPLRHLFTGTEFVGAAARALNKEARLKILRPWMLRMAGLFNGTIAELVETLYQYEGPYVFDSSRFERRFSFSPTPHARGIEETADDF